ncbi:MAG TPA: ATP-binding protein [Vicinamibacterales bacterium]|nr:ATP-binding protein [Vicinamibacterales bacterium]
MSERLLSVSLRREHDVVAARRRARQVAAALGFDVHEQTRIATAVSELARNAVQYAGGGTVEYSLEGALAPQLLTIAIADAGGGISNVDAVLSGRYRSSTGMGVGVVGARRLMDAFDLRSGPDGTRVVIKKILPPRAPFVKPAQLSAIAQTLLSEPAAGPIDEVQQQNRELVATLEALQQRQEELERVNRELEDTNRGVVALYAELEERADHLRRADDLKTRFLSNMTHEFRTPVNSILALTNLLADRLGATSDQKDELFYIRKSAQQLADIVDDLLDIAKVEAGKIEVRPAPFEVAALFGALRGMLRPLLATSSLSLVFEEPEDLPPILSDESKLSQILRNFISNALKYTERGEVRVSARLTPERDYVEFAVADTGIGIPEADLTRVFDEFVQIENPLQKRVKGTGLGLPLSKRLAELLGGSVWVVSEHGVGSTFTVRIPLAYRSANAGVGTVEAGRLALLVVEDDDEDLLLYERALSGTRFQIVPARTVAAAAAAVEMMRPAAIMLDIRLHGQDSWELLARLKREPRTSSIPIVVVSTYDDRRKALALGADACAVKPLDRKWLLETLGSLVPSEDPLRVLTVDDEETCRYIVREMLNDARYRVAEAGTGRDGLRLVRELQPDVVLLDLRLTDMTGFDVCDRLREDPRTARVPVILVTAQQMSDDERRRVGQGLAVLSKAELTRDVLRDAIQDAVARP